MKRKIRPIAILAAICVLAVIGMIFSLIFGGRTPEPAGFTPPPWEAAAVQGTPDVPGDLGYSSPLADGMSYRFSVCGKVRVIGTEAIVYLTNPEGNNVWIKLRILDDAGNILGETGLIKPGEYVKAVRLTAPPATGTRIRLKIMGYLPDTYQSAGAATLGTTVVSVE